MHLNTSALDAIAADACTPAVLHPLPRIAAVVASRDEVLWTGAAGYQTYFPPGTAQPKGSVTVDTPMALFSQTKLVTYLCGLQLLEQGLVQMTDEVERWVPELRGMKILTDFTDDDAEVYAEPTRKVTIRDLFTHTGGLPYTLMSPIHEKYRIKHGIEPAVEGPKGDRAAIAVIPLRFDPGTAFLYSTGVDYLGYVVEAISGLDLEVYTQKHIFDPLNIHDMVYRRSPDYLAKQVNLVTPVVTNGKTTFKVAPFTNPTDPISCGGGGGLHGPASSFIKILQALLNDGLFPATGARILKAETVDLLFTPQITDAEPHILNAMQEWLKYDKDPFHPKPEDGQPESLESIPKRGWGMGSGLNLEDIEGGRREGTLFGSGFADTYWWVDRKAGVCVTFFVNTAPSKALGVMEFWRKFESEIYKSV